MIQYMSKTITIDDHVYALLVSLRKGNQDSFSKVIRRHVHKTLETAGELHDAYTQLPPPTIDLEIFDKVVKGRGRPSGGRNLIAVR
jgi:predicted CopG family antitoxin